MNIQQKKMNFRFVFLSSSFTFLFPTVSFAAFDGINKLLVGFSGLLKLAIPIAYGLAVLFFFYGIAKYISQAGNEKAAKEGKSIMIYGVIAIFVISSVFGIIKFIGNTLGIDTGATMSSSGGSLCGTMGGAGC